MSRFIHSKVFFVASQPPPHHGLDVALPLPVNPPQGPFELSGSLCKGILEARPALQGHTSLCVGSGQAEQPSGWGEGGAAPQARDKYSEPGIEAPLCGAHWGRGCCQLLPCVTGEV